MSIMLIPLFERTSVFVSVNGPCRYAMEEAEKKIREELKCGNSKGRDELYKAYFVLEPNGVKFFKVSFCGMEDNVCSCLFRALVSH